MKTRLNLEDLKVSSFITNLNKMQSGWMKGGSSDPDPQPGTFNSGCTDTDWDSIGPCPSEIPEACFPTSHEQQR